MPSQDLVAEIPAVVADQHRGHENDERHLQHELVLTEGGRLEGGY